MHLPDLPGPLDPEQPLGVATAFARLSQRLLREGDEQALLELVCEQTARVLEADHCGVTLRRRRGRLETPACSDAVVARADALQQELGEGPCVDGALDQPGHLVHDTRDADAWQRWCPAVAELGIRSLVSVRLPGDAIRERHEPFGALTFYGDQPGAFGETHLVLAQVYAVHAANAIACQREVAGLARAADSRHAIGLAQGILRQRYALDTDQAFEVLQRFSADHNVKLREVADRVVAEGSLPGLGEGGRLDPV